MKPLYQSILDNTVDNKEQSGLTATEKAKQIDIIFDNIDNVLSFSKFDVRSGGYWNTTATTSVNKKDQSTTTIDVRLYTFIDRDVDNHTKSTNYASKIFRKLVDEYRHTRVDQNRGVVQYTFLDIPLFIRVQDPKVNGLPIGTSVAILCTPDSQYVIKKIERLMDKYRQK